MIGRLIAAIIFVGCIVLFVAVGYTDTYLRTGKELLQSLGWSAGYERTNVVNREPGYTPRERRETGSEPEG